MGKPKGPPPVAQCKLCPTVGPLTWSHIVSRWTYRRIVQTADPGQPVPAQVRDGVAMLSSDQLADFLLCPACEDLIRPWETYVSTISRDEAGFPALTTALAHLIPGGVGTVTRGADISTLDVDAIAKFGVSVLWRAAACPRLFPKLRLGPCYDAFAQYLRGLAPFPSQACLLLHLIDRDDVPQLSQLIAPPSVSKHRDHHCYAFLIFGMSFEFHVGGRDLSAYEFACLPRTGRALVVDGHRQLRGIAQQAFGAEAKGALAERR
jgi:hypothetical protein